MNEVGIDFLHHVHFKADNIINYSYLIGFSNLRGIKIVDKKPVGKDIENYFGYDLDVDTHIYEVIIFSIHRIDVVFDSNVKQDIIKDVFKVGNHLFLDNDSKDNVVPIY